METNTQEYAKLWKQKQVRDSLVKEIKEEKPDAKITDKIIIEQYFRRYMMLTDKTQLLVNHPGMLKTDMEKIEQVTNDSMKSLVNVSAGCTVGTLLFYKLLLSKRRIFYDFYRKGRFQLMKKILSIPLIFMTWGSMLVFGYKKTIPHDLYKQGMYKKYLVEYEKVFFLRRSFSKEETLNVTFFKTQHKEEKYMIHQKQELQDDYDIFQFLKNDNSTENFVTALTERKEIHHNPQQSVLTTPKLTNNLFDKDHLFLKKFNEIQSKRKQEQLKKADFLLQKDLNDLNRIVQNNVQSFSDHFTLYNQFFIEKLMEPQTCRPDLQLKPKQVFTVLANPNKKEKIYQQPTPKPFIQFEKLINEQPLEQIKKMNGNLQKVSVNLISKVDSATQKYFNLITQGNVSELQEILKESPKLIHSKSRLLETGLHIAVKRNRVNCVEILLQFGIDEFARNIWGETARAIAFKLQYRNILKLLTYEQS